MPLDLQVPPSASKPTVLAGAEVEIHIPHSLAGAENVGGSIAE
jgi:hypothetical protein